jgi:hypothetical protein
MTLGLDVESMFKYLVISDNQRCPKTQSDKLLELLGDTAESRHKFILGKAACDGTTMSSSLM